MHFVYLLKSPRRGDSNIHFVYLLESPRRGDSNKYTKRMIYKKVFECFRY